MIGVHGSSDNRTYVSNSGAILTSGETRDLAVEQIAFFKVDQRGVGITDKAQAKPTAQSAPVFRFGIGRDTYAAQTAGQTAVYNPNGPLLTREIKGRNIKKFTGKKANPNSTTEIWTVGYDGVDASKRLFGKSDYHDLTFTVRLWGQPIKDLTGNKSLIQHFNIDKGCIDQCLDVCDDSPGLADDLIADQLVAKFNTRKFDQKLLSEFVKVTKLRKSAIADPTITGLVTSTRYTLSLCDDGTHSALGLIQSQYPGISVRRTDRIGAISTYRLWKEGTAPASFTNVQPVALAICGVCPSGYTLSAEQDVYVVERSITPTTDLSTEAAQQTYADTIGTAYGAAARQVNALGGVAGTGYTNGTFPLVFAGGGGTGAAGYVVVAGGVITSRVITSGGQNYTSAPTVTAPTVTGGTGATYTATISAAPTVVASFVTANSGTATVRIAVPATVQTLTPQLADQFVSLATSTQYCTPPAGTTVAWTSGITRTRAPKQWMITLEDTVCGTTRLPELQGAYADLVVSEQGTTGPCARVYVTTNYSQPFIADTCSVADYVFTKPDDYLNGAPWVPFVTPLTTPVCTTTPDANVCVAAGVKFETAAFVRSTGECLYGYYAQDISDVDPVYMEITVHSGDYTASPCYKTDQYVTKLRGTTFSTGSGVIVRMSERSTLQQYGKVYGTNQALNDAFGVYFTADPKKWYDTYQITVGHNDTMHGIIGSEGVTKDMTYTFAFPSGQGKAFESLMNGYILSLDRDDLAPVIL